MKLDIDVSCELLPLAMIHIKTSISNSSDMCEKWNLKMLSACV